jgi:hypothetical protein
MPAALFPEVPPRCPLGSLADIGERIRDVRFTPKSGRTQPFKKMSAKCHEQTFTARGVAPICLIVTALRQRLTLASEGGIHIGRHPCV